MIFLSLIIFLLLVKYAYMGILLIRDIQGITDDEKKSRHSLFRLGSFLFSWPLLMTIYCLLLYYMPRPVSESRDGWLTTVIIWFGPAAISLQVLHLMIYGLSSGRGFVGYNGRSLVGLWLGAVRSRERVNSVLVTEFVFVFAGVFLLTALSFGASAYSLGREHFAVAGESPFGFVESLYYSVVTQATVGYGDIAPKTREARGMCALHIALSFMQVVILFAVFSTTLGEAARFASARFQPSKRSDDSCPCEDENG